MSSLIEENIISLPLDGRSLERVETAFLPCKYFLFLYFFLLVFVDLTQTGVTWGEEMLVEELLPSDWSMGYCGGHSLNK